MREWIVPDEDMGCDGEYFNYQELIRCKDCCQYEDGRCEFHECIKKVLKTSALGGEKKGKEVE